MMPVPSKYLDGCPDGFVPVRYLMLHPDGESHTISAKSAKAAVDAARKYAINWVEYYCIDKYGGCDVPDKEGRHTLWRTASIEADVFGDTVVEMDAAWELSTGEIYDAIGGSAGEEEGAQGGVNPYKAKVEPSADLRRKWRETRAHYDALRAKYESIMKNGADIHDLGDLDSGTSATADRIAACATMLAREMRAAFGTKAGYGMIREALDALHHGGNGGSGTGDGPEDARKVRRCVCCGLPFPPAVDVRDPSGTTHLVCDSCHAVVGHLVEVEQFTEHRECECGCTLLAHAAAEGDADDGTTPCLECGCKDWAEREDGS